MSLSNIGRYEVISELAHGSMGIIFLARDPFVHRSVVVKVLNFQFAEEEHHRSFFQQEAKIIASLEHPCIVPIYDFGWIGSQPYFVMRHMEGGTFSDVRKTRDIGLPEFGKIIQRLCEALDAAHARNIIHRDIKPGNILFDLEQKAYLADFGIAKQDTGVADGEDWVVGTPSYMSPEQCLSQPVGPQSDVYSMGVLIFEMLAGERPYLGDALTDILDQHVNAPIPRLADYNPDLHSAWQEIIEKAMAKNPFDRYKTPGDLAKDVDSLVSGRWFWRKLYSEDE